MATHDQALSLDVTAPPLDPDAQEGPPGLLRARQAGRQLLGLLLRHAAGAGWQVPSPGQALARGPQGAPRFGSQPGDGGWHLGLSHSAGHVGAVLGWQVAVGVDLDQPVPGLDWSRLAAHHFHPAEQWSLMRWQGHQRDREALKLWCAKEAVLKAQGVGLHGQLDQVLIVAAASMAALGRWAQLAPMLQPLWSALHAALLVWGLWLLFSGRLPATRASLSNTTTDGWQRMRGPVRSAGIGLAWIALPCGMLQSALLLAALGNGPAEGAAVMAAFWLGAGPVLWLAPSLWLRLAGSARGAEAGAGAARLAQGWPVRLAGATVVVSSGWVLAGGLISRAAAWCFS